MAIIAALITMMSFQMYAESKPSSNKNEGQQQLICKILKT